MSRSFRIAPIILLVALNAWLFWPGSLYFLNDDFIHIPLSDANQLFQTNSVRPLHELLVSFDLWLWGRSAWGFHLTALLLHLVVCWQVYRLSIDLQKKWAGADNPGHSFAAILALALFLVYPQHAEAQAWILGRTPILSAIFLLPVCSTWLQEKVSIAKTILAAVLFLAALFTYEQSIFLPLVFLVFAFLEKQPGLRKAKLLFGTVMAISGVVYLVARQLITEVIIGQYEGGNFLSFDVVRLFGNAARLFARLWINPSDGQAVFLVSVLLLLAALVKIGSALRRPVAGARLYLFCVVMIAALLLPVLSLGVSTRSFESGRFLYLPSIFLVIMLGNLFAAAWKTMPGKAIPVLLLLCGYWILGKTNAARDYREASAYSKQTMTDVVAHFRGSDQPLQIDTLRASIRELPVFRLGFRQGINWLAPAIDTNKVKVVHWVDELGK